MAQMRNIKQFFSSQLEGIKSRLLKLNLRFVMLRHVYVINLFISDNLTHNSMLIEMIFVSFFIG